MNQDLLPYTIEKLGIRSGMKVLDVGCGTGEYTFYLGSATKGVSYTGIDMEDDFICKATETASGKPGNHYVFLSGNALNLPFPDNTFDRVVSQTFLTAVPDYERAASEMLRVCSPGGLIASVLPADIRQPLYTPGVWPFFFAWKKRYDELYTRLWKAYSRYAPLSSMAPGIPPMETPQLFVRLGLQDVSAYPVASLFSLSNPVTPEHIKRRYIELEYLSDVRKIEYYSDSVPGFDDEFPKADADEFRKLAALKRDTLLAAIGENRIWEWQYVPMVLVTGRKAV